MREEGTATTLHSRARALSLLQKHHRHFLPMRERASAATFALTPFSLQIHVDHAFFEDTKVLFRSILHRCVYSLFSKQSPLPDSQIFLYLAALLSDFNLFELYHIIQPKSRGGGY